MALATEQGAPLTDDPTVPKTAALPATPRPVGTPQTGATTDPMNGASAIPAAPTAPTGPAAPAATDTAGSIPTTPSSFTAGLGAPPTTNAAGAPIDYSAGVPQPDPTNLVNPGAGLQAGLEASNGGNNPFAQATASQAALPNVGQSNAALQAWQDAQSAKGDNSQNANAAKGILTAPDSVTQHQLTAADVPSFTQPVPTNPNDTSTLATPTAPIQPPQFGLPTGVAALPQNLPTFVAPSGASGAGAPPADATTGQTGTSSFTSGLVPAQATATDTSVGQPANTPSFTAGLTGNAASTTPNLTPTTADNALTNSTIGAPTLNDPQAIAQQEWDAWERQTDPAYQATLRDANRSAAAAGAEGSGELNTTTGSLARDRALAMDTEKQQLMAGALTTGNENAYRNVGIAQQQQGFQSEQQRTAFSQQMQSQQLSDSEKAQSFTQALQSLLAGSSGSPADTQLALSQIFGGQASAAAAALAALMKTSAQTTASGGANANAGLISQLQQYLKSIGSGGQQGQPGQQPGANTLPVDPRGDPNSPEYDPQWDGTY